MLAVILCCNTIQKYLKWLLSSKFSKHQCNWLVEMVDHLRRYFDCSYKTQKSHILILTITFSLLHIFWKNKSHRNYCNSSLQTRSLGSWISAYLSQVYSIFDFSTGPLLCSVTAKDCTARKLKWIVWDNCKMVVSYHPTIYDRLTKWWVWLVLYSNFYFYEYSHLGLLSYCVAVEYEHRNRIATSYIWT